MPKQVTSDQQEEQAIEGTLEVKKPADPGYKWSLIYPLLREKVPLFALAILSSLVTYFAAQSTGFVQSVEVIPLSVRIGNAFISYIAYIGKMIWPSNLAVLYPYSWFLLLWKVLGSAFLIHPYSWFLLLWKVLGSALLLVAITLVVIWRAKKSPYLATGWLWYTGTLVPVIGIVQAGDQAMADRYTYIPLIGLFIIVAWGVPELLKKWNYRKEMLLASSALSILCLSIITWTQVGYWQNNFTLYDHSLKVTDNNWHIYNARGVAYSDLGNNKQAIEDYDRAIEINAGFAAAYYNRGNAYNILGNYRQAIEDYGKAIEINPGCAEAYYNRGNAYNYLGNYRQEIEDYNKAIEIEPAYSDAYNNRGNAYNNLGNYRQAIEDFNRAIKIKRAYAGAYYNRAKAYAGLGNYKQAIEDYGRVIEINPGYADAYNNRGVMYFRLGNKNLAVNDLRTAAELGNEPAKNFLISQGINW